MPVMQRLVRSLSPRPSWSRQAATVVVCVLGATALRFLIDPLLTGGVPFITVFPAVLIASVWGGQRAGVATLLMGGAIAAYFWLEPFATAELSKLGATTMIAFLVAGAVILFCIHLLHTAAGMARAAEASAGLVAREMQHRIGNKLALIQAIARLSARHAESVEEFSRRFEARLRAMSDAQAVLVPGPGLPANLAAVLRAVLRPFDEERIALNGPDVGIDQRDRPMLALVIHELGTNAVKHGALSVPQGRVSLSWTRSGPTIRLVWSEAGGPTVRPPSRTGFGTQLARAAFPPGRGEVTTDYDPAGLRCTLTLAAADPDRETVEAAPGPLAATSPAPTA